MATETTRGGAVTVLALATVLMVSIERGLDGEVADIHLHAGGQGFWAARMAARLGAEVTLVGPFGGEPGITLRALVEAEGLRVRAIESARPNGVWISDEAEGETPTLAAMQPAPLGRHEEDEIVNALLAEGLESEVTVLTGGPPGMLHSGRYESLTHDLHAIGGRVVADLAGDQLHAALRGGLTAVKVAHDEAQEAGLADGESLAELLAAARRIRSAGAGAVLISRADAPLLAHVGERMMLVETPAFQPVNHRGAGDSMTGATAAALAAGGSVEAALRLAVAAGALNVTRHGLGSGDAQAIRTLAEHVRIRDVDGGNGGDGERRRE
jgi:1-phosphofructokinase